MPELIIFDCDGVLVDSERVCNRVMAERLAELGLRLTFEQTVEHFIGRSLPQCLAIIEALLGKPPPADFETRLAEATRAALALTLRATPGIEAVLDALQSPYCVASNGNRAKMTFTLEKTGLLGRFRGRMHSAEDVTAPKPAPDLFLHAARSARADPVRCVVVEDTPTGVAAARAAGMTVFGFAGLTPLARLQAAGADEVFSSMHQLPELLGSRRAARSGHSS